MKYISDQLDNSFKYSDLSTICGTIIVIILLNGELSFCQKYVQVTEDNTRGFQHTCLLKNVKHSAMANSQSSSFLDGNCYTIAVCAYGCTTTPNREQLVKELEYFYDDCGGPISVILWGSPFGWDQTFGKEDLNGNFKLWSLTLCECEQFSKIDNNAFDKPSLNDLEKLIIVQREGNGIQTMNENTFRGLNKLKMFELKNVISSKKLKAEGVLTPFSDTLEQLIFSQNSKKDSVGYDPGTWLKDAEYFNLKDVDLSGNYFPGTLSENAFRKLKKTEILSLASCSINAIKDRTFVAMMETLQILDLSDNELTTLGSSLLMTFSTAFVELNLSENNWVCNCANQDFIELVKQEKLNFNEDPICNTPVKWAEKSMRVVELCCHEQCDTPEENDVTTKVETSTVETITSESTDATTTTSMQTTIESQESTTDISKDPTTVTTITNEQTTVGNNESTSETSTKPNKPEVKPSKLYLTIILPIILFIILIIVVYLIFRFYCGKKCSGNNDKVSKQVSLTRSSIDIVDEQRQSVSDIYGFLPTKDSNADVNCIQYNSIQRTAKIETINSRKSENLSKNLHAQELPYLHILQENSAFSEKLNGHDSQNDLNASDRYNNISEKSIRQFENTFTAEKLPLVLRSPALPPLNKVRSVSAVISDFDERAPKKRPNEYVRYFSDSELLPTRVDVISVNENFPPLSRAPALPPLNILCLASTQSIIYDEKSLKTIPENLSEHEYQSLDECQGIYGTNCHI